jgi:hypothetical protein
MTLKPDLRNLYQLELPEKLKTKETSELILLEKQTELDQSPAPIASYVFSNEHLKRRVFSDCPAWGWINMPAISFYEEETHNRLREGNVEGAVVAYLASLHNSLQFSTVISRLGRHALLNPSEIKAATRVCDTNYSPLEREIIDSLEPRHLIPSKDQLTKDLTALRKSRGISGMLNLCKFLDKTSSRDLRRWREIAREQGWFSRASIISSHLNDKEEEMQDDLNEVRTYTWLEPLAIRDRLEMGMRESLRQKNIASFTMWVDLYAEKRKLFEKGKYGRHPTYNGPGVPGWFVKERRYDSEDRKMYWSQESVSPLIFSIIFYGGNAQSCGRLPLRVKAAQIYLNKMPDTVPYIKQFWRDLPNRERKEDYPYLPRVCERLGVSLAS